MPGVEGLVCPKDEARDAVLNGLGHVVPLKFLKPPGHLLGFMDVKAFGVQEELGVHLAELGPDNLRFRVHLPQDVLQPRSLLRLNQVQLVQDNEVRALHLIRQELRNGPLIRGFGTKGWAGIQQLPGTVVLCQC